MLTIFLRVLCQIQATSQIFSPSKNSESINFSTRTCERNGKNLYSCFSWNPANICWSSRRLENILKILQHVFSVTIFRLPRRLVRCLQNVLKTSVRRLGRRKIVTMKTSWRRTSWKERKCLLVYLYQTRAY